MNIQTPPNAFDFGPLIELLGRMLWRGELIGIAFVMVVLNLPLLVGTRSTALMFHGDAVRAGEWWRLLTHPFVHVSAYHLILDGVAFFLAYVELVHHHFTTRILFVSAAASTSLLAALIASPLIDAHGLCGLSGVDHGLAAIASLELIRRGSDRVTRRTAVLCFVGVVAKSVFEALSGQVLLASWHIGPLGTPIAACHAGGVLGAICAWSLWTRTPRPSQTNPGPKPNDRQSCLRPRDHDGASPPHCFP